MLDRISLDISSHHWVAIVVALVIGLGLAWWAYRRTNPPLPAALRALLFALRAVVLALLIFALLEPILSLIWKRTEQPVVALLVDGSASMSISEGEGDRLDQVRAFLAGPVREQMAAGNRVETYLFAEGIRARDGDSLRADGRATDISGALEAVRRELSDENLSAMVLLTDGANNLGRSPVHLTRSLGMPVFPMGVGSTEPRRDLSIKEVLANDVVYVDSRVPVEVIVQSQGLEGLEVPVILSRGEEVLDSRQIVLGGQGREQRAVLEFVPRDVGTQRLKVSVPPQDGELSAGNNRRDLSVRVLKSKIRVLLIWGSPGWDFSFLRRSLERDPNVELTPLVFKDRQGFFLGDFPADESRLREFDVVILGDMAALRLSTQRQEQLGRLVAREGKGLLFLGGAGFGLAPGSPLDELFPLTLAGGRGKGAKDRFWAELSVSGRVHPVMALVEEALDQERVWQDLPPFLGLNQFGPAKPGATVLAVHPTLRAGQQKLPLVAAHRSGLGKAMVVAAYPLWRWDFMLWGLGQNGQTYDRFWSNAVRWLATREEGELIRVTPVSNVFRSGQRIGFQARLYDESYRPLDRAQVRVMAMRRESPETAEVQGDLFESGRRDGQYRGELGVLSPGEYIYRAEVSLGGQVIGRVAGEFYVEAYSLEFERVELNEELLMDMAAASGGVYFHLRDAAELPDKLRFESRETSRRREFELWNAPGVLIALVVLLAVEWTIRKKNRLL